MSLINKTFKFLTDPYGPGKPDSPRPIPGQARPPEHPHQTEDSVCLACIDLVPKGPRPRPGGGVVIERSF